MVVCPSCDAKNSDTAALCIACGAWIGERDPSFESPDLAPMRPPAAELLVPVRAYFINRPWFNDWVFWLAAVLTTIGGVQNLYREGTAGIFAVTSASYLSALITILFFVPLSFAVFGALPALVRWPFRQKRFNKLLTQRPQVESQGWKSDPFDSSFQRWWTGSFWSQGTRPQKGEKAGLASFLIIIGVAAAMFVAFLVGTASSGVNADPGLTNIDNGDFLNTLEEVENAESVDEFFTTSVADAYFRTTEGLNDYYAVQIDLENMIPQYIELQGIVNDLQASQSDLQGLITAATTQEMLVGASAPDVNALRDFTSAVGDFVSTRSSFYQSMEACEPLLTPGREYGLCDDDAFAIWEAPMTQTLAPLASAYQSVVDSMKSE